MHPHNQGNMNNYGGYQPNEERIRAIQARIMANAWAMQQQAERDGLRPLAAPTQQRQIVNDPAQPPPLQHTAPAAAQQQPPPPSAERVQQPTPERQATAARGRQHQASAGAASKPRKFQRLSTADDAPPPSTTPPTAIPAKPTGPAAQSQQAQSKNYNQAAQTNANQPQRDFAQGRNLRRGPPEQDSRGFKGPLSCEVIVALEPLPEKNVGKDYPGPINPLKLSMFGGRTGRYDPNKKNSEISNEKVWFEKNGIYTVCARCYAIGLACNHNIPCNNCEKDGATCTVTVCEKNLCKQRCYHVHPNYVNMLANAITNKGCDGHAAVKQFFEVDHFWESDPTLWGGDPEKTNLKEYPPHKSVKGGPLTPLHSTRLASYVFNPIKYKKDRALPTRDEDLAAATKAMHASASKAPTRPAETKKTNAAATPATPIAQAEACVQADGEELARVMESVSLKETGMQAELGGGEGEEEKVVVAEQEKTTLSGQSGVVSEEEE